MSEQRCGTCRYNVTTFGEYGNCQFPMPEWVLILLKRVHYDTFPGEVLGPPTVLDHEGKDCPTWQPK